MTLKAGIFDLDGVITDTAKIHYQAWEAMFNEFLDYHANQSNNPYQPFTHHDYLKLLDGKPRIDGVQSFLADRKIELPLGSAQDNANQKTVYGLAEKKQDLFLEFIERDGVPLFKSTLNFIKQLHLNRIRTAIVSSSKNCKLLLQKAGIESLFETRVDGVTLIELELQGKPKPDMFLEAARRCTILPQEAFVVEDALSGVEAGKAGDFGLVIGVDRKGDMAEQLRFHGADWVVNDLKEMDVEQMIQYWDKK